MLDPEDPRVRWATFGKQVEDFLSSEIGDFLLGKSQREIEEATEILKRVHPWRSKRIQQLQNQIHVAEQFQRWLADAITAGHASIEDLKEEHNA